MENNDKSGHNFSRNTTAELSCHVQYCALSGQSQTKLEQNKFSYYQLINVVKWAPGDYTTTPGYPF